ncbi:MAG: FAD synthase [Candidatus Diapherotrites archaeon]|uniref:FAD synthase n=1 Tax=Candidatus Iainarchaeum sp. TaxID=3101447 RepID=A0A8T4LAB3_9ARCH|nr:FAD synthase [Candidatus Diapherotrites archaeon]
MTTKKKIRVLGFGTFDLLHAGHLSYLTQAKKLGDELFVIVARDSNVKQFKGFFPVHNEKTRLALVQNLKMVDHATLGDKKDFFSKIKKLAPAVIAQGYDQWPGKKELEKMLVEHAIPAKVVRMKPFRKEHHKTTIIKERIKREY